MQIPHILGRSRSGSFHVLAQTHDALTLSSMFISKLKSPRRATFIQPYSRQTCRSERKSNSNAVVDMDAPSAQLHQELRAAVTSALSTRRPILHHLSADTAWLLQIPRPQQATRRGGRLYFNILIDPWLSGTQTDVSSWLSKQWHAVKPGVPSIAAVEELIREIEILASGLRLGKERKSNVQEVEENGEIQTLIDAVAISHEFTDHCHRETLLQVHQDVPVLATEVGHR